LHKQASKQPTDQATKLTLPPPLQQPNITMSFSTIAANVNVNSQAQHADIPANFICPLTKTLMVNPLMSKTGHSFDRDAIMAWVSKNGTCPITGKPLNASDLITNHALRIKIDFWCNNNGIQVNSTKDLEAAETEHVFQSLQYLTLQVPNKPKACEDKNSGLSLLDVTGMTMPTTTAVNGDIPSDKMVNKDNLDISSWNRQRLSVQIAKVLAEL
jgi:U-box domain